MTPSDLIFWEIVLGGMLRLATPIFLAALGEVLSERVGTLNLGIDGILTAGAFSALVGAAQWGWGAGIAAALVTGALYGLVMALAIVRGGANQIITGIAISLIGVGLTSYLFQLWQPSGQSAVFVQLAPKVEIPLLADIPVLGPILFQQNIVTYLSVVLLIVVGSVLRYTRLGLTMRAAGDASAAASLRGVNVTRLRYFGIIAGACLMALAGASITIGFLGSFNEGISGGRGYVALAVVIIGRWTPLGAFLGAFLFAFFDSFSLRVQGDMFSLPTEVYSMLPYAMTLLVLVFAANSRAAPRELGK